MAKRITFFNHKGGVGKTTTIFNLGWMLAEKGKTVLIVDADPQCNLTGMVLGFDGINTYEEFYARTTNNNIRSGLAPAFEAEPRMIGPVECTPVSNRDGLFLLPGHIQLSEYEVTLGLAQQLTSAILTLKNLPGSISYLLNITAEDIHAEYILVDLNPSLSAINQNLLMTSNFFIVPTNPDYFSLMAINSLSRIMNSWKDLADKVYNTDIVQRSSYPFPKPCLKFMGTIIQNFRKRGGDPAKAFQEWTTKIQAEIASDFLPVLRRADCSIPDSRYNELGIENYTLSMVPTFNSLIAKSQKYKTPVFALNDKQLEQAGVVLGRTRKNKEEFHSLFSNLADKVIGLADDAERTVAI
jgi:cellulose biosynthesis protein BcsQ